MKHMNIVISVIIAAAVLVAAYGIGLLVRHARTPDRPLTPAGAESPAALKTRLAQQSPGGRLAGAADSNEAARIQRERAQALEKTKNMTKEQKRRFMEEQAVDRFSAASSKGRSRKLSPEEREKAAFGTRIALPEPVQGQPPQAPAEAGSTAAPQSTEPNNSEPNKAGKG